MKQVLVVWVVWVTIREHQREFSVLVPLAEVLSMSYHVQYLTIIPLY